MYYNNGAWDFGEIYGVGNTGVIDPVSETQLGTIGNYRIKSRMVLNEDKTQRYGQYVYSDNLGEMGGFDVEAETPFKLDHHSYSLYPYGWDYNNYSISTNGNRLAYGYVLFNANDLLMQYGVFQELVYALNEDGGIAFGSDFIWDTITFIINREATALLNHNLGAKVMQYDSIDQVLYAFSSNDFSVKKIEIRLDDQSPVDSDGDGLSDAEEIAIGADPNNWDTDGDGLDDGAEVANGLDPLSPNEVTPEMRALMAILRRDAGQLNVSSPVIWTEYNHINISLQLEVSDDLQSFRSLGEPVVFRIPMNDLNRQQFYRINIK